ncbi:MAG: hypothetical protein HFH87_00130 [Lachnospiraceae bacterium]|nr:hypothetical protein [Lachnospiraceae bacterium]
MKKRTEKIIAMMICGAMVCGGAGQGIRALAAGESQEAVKAAESTGKTDQADRAENEAGNKDTESTTKEKEAAKGKDTVKTGREADISKEETVYILAGSDGSPEKIIVSDWLQNAAGADTIKDRSELTDVENVKGDETCTTGTDSTQVWDAKGKDIYYQGNIEKELPVDIAVTYTLDGKKITPEALAGKSGKVTIRFDYENRQFEYVEVDGVRTKIYVPFAVMTGMVLDTEVFRNVEVTNGKLINDGDRTAVVGAAFPGLQENLALDREKLDIPDYLEITADVVNFESGMIMAVASSEVFGGIDMEDKDITGELGEALEQLTDAMGQLEDGSSQLYDGLCTLLDKSDELIKGVDRLAAGAGELHNGAGTLEEGAARLQEGAAKLQTGLNTLTANNGELNGGAKQVFETLLSTAQTQLKAAGLDVPAMTIDNYGEVLNAAIASLDGDAVYQQALGFVTAEVEKNRAQFETAVTSAVKDAVTEKVTAAVTEGVTEKVTAAFREQVAEQVIKAATNGAMTKEDYDKAVAAGTITAEMQEQVNENIKMQMESEAVRGQISTMIEKQMREGEGKAQVEANVSATMESEEIKHQIADTIELEMQKKIAEEMAGSTVQDQLNAASEGAKSVIALKTSLDSYDVFYKGLQTYTAGVAEAAAGAGELAAGTGELRSGAGKLYAGTSELCAGIQTMKNSTPALTEGITKLRDGALQLKDGLQEFDEEGIQKLVEAMDGDLEGLVERLRATTDAAKAYQSFAGIGDDMEGKVKFVYQIKAVEAGTE